MDNFKFYSGINEDNLKKEIELLKKEGHSVTDMKFMDVEDQFILFYNKDITKPSTADLQKDIHGDVPPFQNYYPQDNPQRPMQNIIIEYLKEYWYVAGFIGFGLFYYFIVYK